MERNEKRKKINEVFSPRGGLFQQMEYVFPEGISGLGLDIEFFTSYGERPVSPIVEYLLENETEFTSVLATLILQRYKFKWDKLQEVLAIEYNPIEPFNQTLDETANRAITDAKNNSYTENENATRTDNLSESTSHGMNTTSTRTNNLTESNNRNLTTGSNENINDKLYGFNSTTSVGDSDENSQSTVTDSGTVTKLNTGTQVDAVQNTGTDTVDNTGTQKNDILKNGINKTAQSTSDILARLAVRHGNIGNMSNQQLIRAEIDLWKWNFVAEVLDDVKEFTTIPIYV